MDWFKKSKEGLVKQEKKDIKKIFFGNNEIRLKKYLFSDMFITLRA